MLDLLFHLPSGTVDRRARPVIRDVVPGSVATVSVTVDRHRPPPPNRPRAPYQIYASDDTGDLILTFFHAKRDYLEKLLPVGEQRNVSGTTALYDGMLQMVHPDRVVSEAELEKLPLVEPVYPLTEGLTINVVRKAVDAALTKVPQLPEWQDDAWLERNGFPDFTEALLALHVPTIRPTSCPRARPGRGSPMTNSSPASSRSRWSRQHQRTLPGRGSSGEGMLRARVIKALPYALTPSQGARGGRHRHRSGASAAHGAAAAGRRRLRQDRGGAARRRDRDRGRPAGRADGADRNPRPAASRHHRAARREGRSSASPS